VILAVQTKSGLLRDLGYQWYVSMSDSDQSLEVTLLCATVGSMSTEQLHVNRAASSLGDFSQNINVTIESPRFSRKLSFLRKLDGSIVTTLHIAIPEQRIRYCIMIARVQSSKVQTGLYRRRHQYHFAGF
jgi:hypothetical protein